MQQGCVTPGTGWCHPALSPYRYWCWKSTSIKQASYWQATNTNFVLLGQRKDLLKGYRAAHKPSKRSKKNRRGRHTAGTMFMIMQTASPARKPGLQLLGTDLTPLTTATTAVSLSTLDSAWSLLRGGHWLPVQSLEWQGYNRLNIDHGLCPCAGAKEARKGAPGTVCFETARGPRPLKVSHSLDTGGSLRNEWWKKMTCSLHHVFRSTNVQKWQFRLNLPKVVSQ